VVQLTRNTGRDDHDVGAGESALETVILGQVSGNSLLPFSNSSCVYGASFNSYRWCGDVREVGSDTWCVDDIVEGELVNELAVLEEERERLLGGQLAVAFRYLRPRRGSVLVPVQCLRPRLLLQP
jgi:hypothetical protein